MNDIKAEYRYVAFKQVNGWNVTLRSDNWEDLVLEMEMVDNQFPQANTQRQAVNTPTPEAQNESGEAKSCPKHGVPMSKNKNGKWYHREFKDGQAQFCNSFGFPYEKYTDR